MIAVREKLTFPTVSLREYLAFERRANSKHEYLGGQIIAMAGATHKHNVIASNMVGSLLRVLESVEGDYEVLFSDQRVNVLAGDAYFYPDICVVRDTPIVDEDECLRTPYLIIVVLSKSTSTYDRTEKYSEYQKLPSLRHFLLVAQDRVHIEHFERHGDEWLKAGAYEHLEQSVRFTDIAVSLPVAAAYRRVQVDPEV